MTTSFWNKEELEKQFAQCGTVKDVISKIETDFSSRGEVICEIRINGMIIDENDETTFATNPAFGIHDLAVKSDRPSDLINGALVSAQELVPKLEAAATTTAEKLRGSELVAAQNSFMEILDGCQWLIDTLNHVRGAASGIGKPVQQAERWLQAEALTGQTIREVTAACEKLDWILVADLLEYELTAALSVWREALKVEIARRG